MYIYIYYIYIYIFITFSGIEILLFVKQCQLKFMSDPESIDRTHRLGKKQQNTGRPRPIIVKLSTYNARHKIFRNKKVLKGKGVSITESLTQKRVELLKKAREEHGFKSVWTQDGKILFVDNVDNKIKVYYD